MPDHMPCVRCAQSAQHSGLEEKTVHTRFSQLVGCSNLIPCTTFGVVSHIVCQSSARWMFSRRASALCLRRVSVKWRVVSGGVRTRNPEPGEVHPYGTEWIRGYERTESGLYTYLVVQCIPIWLAGGLVKVDKPAAMYAVAPLVFKNTSVDRISATCLFHSVPCLHNWMERRSRAPCR